MKSRELSNKNAKELATMLEQQRQQLAQTLIDLRTKQPSNVRQARAIKKSIARILTLKRGRELSSLEDSNA